MPPFDDFQETECKPAIDPRILAMQRLVDLESESDEHNRRAEEAGKKASIVRTELAEARADLHSLLGLDRTEEASPSDFSQIGGVR